MTGQMPFYLINPTQLIVAHGAAQKSFVVKLVSNLNDNILRQEINSASTRT